MIAQHHVSIPHRLASRALVVVVYCKGLCPSSRERVKRSFIRRIDRSKAGIRRLVYPNEVNRSVSDVSG